MNFFDAQDQARRSTRRLVILYLLAAAAIVVSVSLVIGFAFSFTQTTSDYATHIAHNQKVFGGAGLFAILVIAGATLVKTRQLRSGGGRVAQDLGGTLVGENNMDPLHQRLRNVVEEMALASGVPVPEIYVLENEQGINAFAAGYAPEDAAVAVTRGALELLNRDELQGVIAHEFSHVLNGDMRLNIRLMGVLFGIIVLTIIGRRILFSMRHVRSRDGAKLVAVGMVVAVGLLVVGGLGAFFARLIKASVSRQREYLADASAVQFTRQTSGIANALKKIGGYEAGSRFQLAEPEEVSHMLFGTGSNLSSIFATHPPLTQRIQALDPSFKPEDYPDVDYRATRAAHQMEAAEQYAGVAAAAAGGAASVATDVSPDRVVDNVGHPSQEQVEFAGKLRQSIPELLYAAAHSPNNAYLLAIALIFDRSGRVLERQLSLAYEQLGEQRANLVKQYYDEIKKISGGYRLPLLEIAFPALRQRKAAELEYLIDLARRLIEVDGEIDLYEYCFNRVLVSSLQRAMHPSRRKKQRSAKRAPVRKAAIDLLRIIAHHGHQTDNDGEKAFRAGLQLFGSWAHDARYDVEREFAAPVLDRQLDLLSALNGEGRQMIVKAISNTVAADGKLTNVEADLLRAVCATLAVPLPPILTS
ncbi:MAG: M48 family metalloprotease [Woeseiaceae bacterium]|nr:M48 family metalloprotease [Woeseiaceae bacterium]